MTEEIAISKNFIEQELPDAPPLYVSVYLMTLLLGRDEVQIAEKLRVTQSDVLRAWLYWTERGVMQQAAEQKPEPPQSVAQKPQSVIPPIAARPDYTPQELAVCLTKSPDFKNLLDHAAKKMGKMLSQSDMSTLFSLHDWLGLPLDVIELLISYCTANGQKGMRYIEKVAIGWAEEDIRTEEKAIAYIEMRKSGFRTILKAFGLGNRMPVAAEEKYMKAWLTDYALPLEIIQIACERTVLQTGKASFPYADKILRKWHEAGVKTQADIDVLDQTFAAQKQQTQASAAPARTEPPKPKNRFINYTQSEWDFEELERLEREQRKKW